MSVQTVEVTNANTDGKNYAVISNGRVEELAPNQTVKKSIRSGDKIYIASPTNPSDGESPQGCGSRRIDVKNVSFDKDNKVKVKETDNDTPKNREIKSGDKESFVMRAPYKNHSGTTNPGTELEITVA